MEDSTAPDTRTDDQLQYLYLEGRPGKFNNVLYASEPLEKSEVTPELVCYFGGDIQHFTKQMSPEYQDNYGSSYSLEAVVQRLRYRFPRATIAAIAPAYQFQQTFSCFENFYETVDATGTPRYAYTTDAMEHLDSLVRRLVKDTSNQQIPVTLIGFSKGGTVLNQILISLHTASTSEEPRPIYRTTLTSLYFLDTGHNGLNGVWILDPAVIKSLALYASNSLPNPPLNIQIGVTAFQLESKGRGEWIRREEAEFGALVKRYGVVDGDKELLKLSRLYLGTDGKRLRKDALMRLHFSILDQLFDQKL